MKSVPLGGIVDAANASEYSGAIESPYGPFIFSHESRSVTVRL